MLQERINTYLDGQRGMLAESTLDTPDAAELASEYRLNPVKCETQRRISPPALHGGFRSHGSTCRAKRGFVSVMPNKFYEREAVSLVMSGVLEITPNGEIWRIKEKKNGSSPFFDCLRRAEFDKGNKYLSVRIRLPKRKFYVLAHRLVWQYFFGDIPEGMQINHKNGIKSDNRPENLEVVTPSENCLHGHRVLGLGNLRGEAHHQSKLTSDQVLAIRRRVKGGERKCDLADEYGVSRMTISDISLGHRWKHFLDSPTTCSQRE